jgi:hypothetical protein
MADEHWSNPAESSLRYAGQGTIRKRGAEIYLQGSAWAPKGRPVTELRTHIRVAGCSKEVHVVGDRYWSRGAAALGGASPPEPFVSMPLRYERAFGGTARADDGSILAQEPRNPVGRGIYARWQDAVDQPIPNLEEPGKCITSWNGRATPTCYGPIPGNWQPRLSMAGTYDERWVEERAPLWPRDTDPAFFCAAAPGLSAPGPLRGGEPVILEGFSPDGIFSFSLPEYRIVARSIYAHRTMRGMMQLDGVLLEPDDCALTLFWRRLVPLGHGSKAHLRSVVRVLESWEEAPS